MSTNAIWAAGLFLAVWGLFLAWFQDRVDHLTLLYSFIALSAALFAVLAFAPGAGENEVPIVLALLGIPPLLTAYLVYRLSSD